MTKYYVYYLDEDGASMKLDEEGKALKPFDNAKAAVQWAKENVKNTDGTFALQIIGFDDRHEPVYTQTIVAKRVGKYDTRGRVLQYSHTLDEEPLDMHPDAVTARKYMAGDPETVRALEIFR